ncbi:MAG: ROK family protein [Clostridiales bacterium]|nr:ROK family protein [Clostridiales bacterium]
MKIIGIDIGGTFIKGVVCEKDNIIFQTKTPTNAQEGKDAVLRSLFSLIDELLPMADNDAPIGVASAGDINPYTGEVVYATETLPGFTGLPLGRLISEHTGREVTVLNDADAALVGEMAYGAGQDKPNAVLFTLGTGLGSGIAVDGHILLGTRFHAARLGHIPLYPQGRQCTCGELGCAEQYVSVTGLVRTALDFGFEVKVEESDKLMKAAINGDGSALLALNKFLQDFCAVIMTTQNLLDPDVILVGGGLIQLKEYWWDRLIKMLPERAAGMMTPAKLKNSAGCLGAAAATNKEYFSKVSEDGKV